ncbi:uncharacterized protein DUF4174 [Pacificibacter maritimus]|uniref:Uncharacterized protein DUF4174 n=1 Tax=Pacificibacter maritimus TaxID=762213 RepID=A0A3N4VGI3_9RHOB|nr:DUF4174 domain-containing protein [Pacificibacter maritimus]RPE72044.1 uncharacterized protein DUF4174 [Pacificibacter maritimus]
MKHIFISALCAFLITTPLSSFAQNAATPVPLIQPATDVELDDFKWTDRVIVVFADTPLDLNFRRQMELLIDRPEQLTERDVIVLTDTNPDTLSAVRKQLRPRGFTFVVVDKDGTVMFRKPDPWDLREITRAIDKTPLRQQEIKADKEAARTTR